MISMMDKLYFVEPTGEEGDVRSYKVVEQADGEVREVARAETEKEAVQELFLYLQELNKSVRNTAKAF